MWRRKTSFLKQTAAPGCVFFFSFPFFPFQPLLFSIESDEDDLCSTYGPGKVRTSHGPTTTLATFIFSQPPTHSELFSFFSLSLSVFFLSSLLSLSLLFSFLFLFLAGDDLSILNWVICIHRGRERKGIFFSFSFSTSMADNFCLPTRNRKRKKEEKTKRETLRKLDLFFFRRPLRQRLTSSTSFRLPFIQFTSNPKQGGTQEHHQRRQG